VPGIEEFFTDKKSFSGAAKIAPQIKETGKIKRDKKFFNFFSVYS